MTDLKPCKSCREAVSIKAKFCPMCGAYAPAIPSLKSALQEAKPFKTPKFLDRILAKLESLDGRK